MLTYDDHVPVSVVDRFRQAGRAVVSRMPQLSATVRNVQWMARRDKSQGGEQGLLARHLPASGTYLEIGAFQPVMMSNSWSLARRGWRGWSIDANAEYAVQWRRFRPSSTFRCLAITPDDRDGASFFVFDDWRGAVSSLDEDHVKRWSDTWGVTYTSVTVPSATIERVLAEFHRSFGGAPTLLLMDCEGMDGPLARSMVLTADPSLWPRFLLIEVDDPRLLPVEILRHFRVIDVSGPSALLERSA